MRGKLLPDLSDFILTWCILYPLLTIRKLNKGNYNVAAHADGS